MVTFQIIAMTSFHENQTIKKQTGLKRHLKARDVTRWAIKGNLEL